MKPAPFDYLAPSTVDEAVAALDQPGAVVLAGGQSLLIDLAYRSVRPGRLVDVNGVAELGELARLDGALHVGALVRHREFEHDDGSGPLRRLLAMIAPWVAHPPIRNRGTFCGSMAWAHPSAEWNLLAVALDALITVRSHRGTRSIAAADWFRGAHRTAIEPGELVVSAALPDLPPTAGVGFAEHRRTHASFADVAAVAVLAAGGPLVTSARIAVTTAQGAVRLPATEEAVLGEPRESAAARVHSTFGPASDHRAAVTAELARRAVAMAAA